MFSELQSAQIEKWLLNPYMYLAVAALIIISYMRSAERIDRRYWLETISDFLYGAMYAAIYFPLIAITLNHASKLLLSTFPDIEIEAISQSPIWIKLVIIILVDDFLSYWSHRIRHEFKPLWYFHAIHHSQKRLNPFTTKRFHPLENLLHKVVIMMVPLAMMGGGLEIVYAYFLLDAFWDYFIHSNIRMNLGPLKHIVVTPQFHRIHHSIEKVHFDLNYSDRLVIWDRLFGTMYKDFETYPSTGVPGYPEPTTQKLTPFNFLYTHLQDLIYPFRMIANDIREKFPLKKKIEKPGSHRT